MPKCKLCPRECGVDRERSVGFCGENKSVRLARAALHFWEEPCISGKNGSGTVFFSGCNLGCVYCQNEKISRGHFGQTVTQQKLTEIFNMLIDKGAENINLVTPTHFIPQIAKALEKRLPVPVIYNCGGYESTESLKMLDGLIDVYLPDMKYSVSAVAEKYSHAADYPSVNTMAVKEMYRQTGGVKFSDGGIIQKGVIVRHLILPGNLINTKGVIKRFAEMVRSGMDMRFSLMAQYTPCANKGIEPFDELKRKITPAELHSARLFLSSFPEIEGYFQDVEASDKEFIPDFDLTGIE